MDDRDKDRDTPADEDGEGLWAYVTRSVRPLWREERASREQARPPAKPAARKEETTPPAAAGGGESFLERLLHHLPAAGGTGGGGAAHPGAGLDRNTDRKLKRGQMPIEARLDLHGHARDAACDALRNFIMQEAEKGRRCVLVITGKGRADMPGVLRMAVPQWLGEAPLRDLVLRFYPAQPQHGGAGALYVLLRRRRDY